MHHPLNLRVLQRHDPTITAILDATSYAVLYNYAGDRWHKTGKEGTLFIYERSQEPTKGIFLLNRSSPENFSHPILSSTELDLQGKVLMFEDAGPDDSNVVSGLWVSNGEEGQKLLDRLTEIRDALKPTAPPPLATPAASDPLASLLSSLANSSAGLPADPSPPDSPCTTAPVPSASASLASSSGPLAAFASSSASATTTTTTATTHAPVPSAQPAPNGSLSFSEILNRLSSPALAKATPSSSPAAPQSPARQTAHHHPHHHHHQHHHHHHHPPSAGSPAPYRPGPSRPHPLPGAPPPDQPRHVLPSQPAQPFFPYPPHQLHHQQSGAHQPPVHVLPHVGPSQPYQQQQQRPSSQPSSPYQAAAVPAPYPYHPIQQQQAHQPFPSSPLAQHAGVAAPLLPSAASGLLPNDVGPPFPGLPHPLGAAPQAFPRPPAQQQQQPANSPLHSPARPYGRSTSFPTDGAGAPALPRGTQLLDAMFSSLGPPVPHSSGH